MKSSTAFVPPKANEYDEPTVAAGGVPVIEIAHMRDELAAYPVESGPRRIFEVRTADARLRLAYEKRRRRWTLEGLEAA